MRPRCGRRLSFCGSAALCGDGLDGLGDDVGGGYEGGLGESAEFELDLPFGEASGADGDAEGDADEIGVLEFDARAEIAVVDDDIHARGGEFTIDALCLFDDGGLVELKRCDDDLVGGERHGPDDAVFVVVLLDGSGHGPGDTDAVTAHDHGVFFALVVEDLCLHLGGILGAEVEDLTDFDALEEGEGSAAAATSVARASKAEIGVGEFGEVAGDGDPDEVVVGFVGSHGAAHDGTDGGVGEETAAKSDGAGEADGGAGDLEDGGFVCEEEGGGLEGGLYLDLVDLEVAAHEDSDGLLVCEVEDGLDDIGGGQAEEAGDLFDGADGGGVALVVGARRNDKGGVVCLLELGLFDVGSVVTGCAADDGVFAGVGEHLELVGHVAADVAGVGLDGAIAEPAAVEDADVGVIHDLVGPFGGLFVDVEAVAVLHDELSSAEEACAGADFVAELGLDLEEVEGELAVAFDVVADERGHDLFVGGPDAEVAAFAVLYAEEFGAVVAPALGLFPEFSGLDGGEEDLLCAGAGHLFADDGLDALDDSDAEGHVTVDAGSDFAHVAGAEEELVADDLSLLGHLFEGGREQCGVAHRTFGVNLSVEPAGASGRRR